MKVLLAAALVIAATVTTTATAADIGAWKVTTSKDPMTDRMETRAVLMPREGGTAALYIGCLNGRVTPRLLFTRRIGYVQTGGTWRIDDGPVRSKFVALSSDGESAWLEVPPGQIAKAKRLRAQIGSQPISDFNLIGADEALKGIKCK